MVGMVYPREYADAIRLLDFHSGEVVGLLKGHTSVVDSLTFSPDGRYLASGQQRSIRCGSGTWGRWKETHVLRGHGDDDLPLWPFPQTAGRVVSGSDDKTLRLWDAKQGRLIKEMKGHKDAVWSAVFSPDGHHIASGSNDKTIRLWNAKTGDFIKVLGSQ